MSHTPGLRRARSVVVIGAGVIGLTTAIELLQRYPDTHCVVVAEHLPGDNKTIDYTSPWAGAHHVTHANGDDVEEAATDMESFEVFQRQQRDGETSAIMEIDQYEYFLDGFNNGPVPEGLRLCNYPELADIPKEELPPEVSFGIYFKTMTIDTPTYLEYLAKRFTAAGGKIVRAKLDSLNQAMTYADTRPDLIVNCTGLGALTLGDVEDKAVFPTRGQLCIIRAPWIKHGKTVKGEGWSSYTIPRSSGVVIIGGTKEGRDWEAAVRPETTQLMLERAVRYDRDLLPPEKREYGTWEDLDLLEVGVGRRPSRNGGVRRELCEGPEGVPVLHHYGHSGSGYQNSWGAARRAIDLLVTLFGEAA